jgi:hemolysin activation/secretion protein
VKADNHGAVFTGDNRLLTMVDWLNPTGIGDKLTVGLLKSWSPLNSDVALFKYRAPLWDERTYGYLSADVNDFIVDGDGDSNIDDLNIEGTNTSYTLGIDRQFKRLPGFGWGAGLAISEKETEISALIDLPAGGEKVQGVQLNFSANHISKRFAMMNFVMASVQYGEFKDGLDEDLGQDAEFYKLAVDWSALKLIDLPFTDLQSYILTISKLRYSESALPAFEQLPLGGADAVRAFTVSDFSADQAAYLGAEWYVEFPASWMSESIEDKLKLALFVDGAYGSTNVEVAGGADNWAHLSGVGLLFKFSWRDRLSTKISVSKPLASHSNMDFFGDDADSMQTFIEFTLVFD